MENIAGATILSRLGRGRFFRNVFVVMSGTAVAQLIGFAFSPILSRLYGPIDFGIFGTYLSVTGVIGAATTLNYTDALMLPKRDEDAAALFLVACLATAVIALGTGAFCLLTPRGWREVLGLGRLGSALWLLPLSVLLFGTTQSLTTWCTRLQAFKTTSQSQVIRSTAACAAQAGGGMAGLGGLGLIGGGVLAEASAMAFLGRATLVRSAALFRASAHWATLRGMAREYREFALYGSPQNVMNALSQGLPVLVLAHYYGAAVAGSYAFGIRLLQVPMNFVLTSIRQVLFQKLSHIRSSGGDLYTPFLKSTGALLGICLVPAGVGFLVAPPLFAFVFGEEWRVAGEYARWLILWLAPMFCNVPASLAARIVRLQRDLFLVDVGLLGARAAALVLGGLWLEPLQTIIVLSLVGALFNIAFVAYVGVRLKRPSPARM